MKTILILLSLSFNLQANELFKPLFDNSVTCSTEHIIKALPSSYSTRVNLINTLVNKIAIDLEVNPCLILSMVWVESTFKATIESNKGAKGLMQLMDRTKASMVNKIGYNLNLIVAANLDSGLTYNEIENLIIGTFYIKRLIKRFKGNISHAIMAYNHGPTWVSIQLSNGAVLGKKNRYLNKVNSSLELVTNN